MLIGFSGKSFSGKDTAYERIVKMYGDKYVVKNVKYAHYMKMSIAATFGVTVEELDEYKRDPNAAVTLVLGDRNIVLTLREFFQRFGSQGHRDIFGQNFWIDLTFRDNIQNRGEIVCITDVRLPDEALAVKDFRGLMIHLDYDSPVYANSRESSHDTEDDQIIGFADIIIDNNERADSFKHLDDNLRDAVDLYMNMEILR